MARTKDAAGNSFNNARYMGSFNSKTRSITDTVGGSDSNDYFRVKFRKNCVSEISLTKLSGDVDMEIYYGSSSSEPAVFSNSGKKSEVAFDINAPAGTYYIRVLPGTSREAQYTLTVRTIALPSSYQTSRASRTGREEFKATRNHPRKNARLATLWT
jgi:serine protease